MAELYAKPYEIIDTGYNPQQPQQSGQDAEMQAYLSSLPPEERQRAIERINAPLTGEELSMMASSGQKIPTLEEFAEIEKYHKTQEVSFIDGLGKIAEGGEQVVNDLTNAFSSFVDAPLDATKKLPATAVEAFAQGTRNFYGMLAQSQNPDSVLFGVKDFLTGGGTIEDRYQQYLKALKFNKHSADLAEGRDTLVMDKDVINPEITQAMAYIADPTLFVPFGKVASTGLRAVGLGEKLTMAGAKAAAIKNGIIGGTLKWGVGQPLEFLGGAVRNTIDYGVEKAGAAFEATTGISGKEFAQTARMSGIGFSASGIAGHAVPYASTISDAYIVGSSARGFGEAITLLGETMSKNKFGRGINSWAAESLDQARKNGVALSPHAKGLLNTLNAVDPLFAYGWNGLETAAEGAVIGGTLGYLGGGEEGMYSGIGAGIALGSVGGTAGKAFADVTGGTNVARRAVQAKMVIEGLKETNPERAMFFQAMQKATEVKGKDVDLVNGIIAGIDNVAPNFEFHALTPDQFIVEAAKKGYDPATGKFREMSAIDVEFGSDRASKSRAMYVLRSIGGEFVGDRAAFLDALKKASAKDSANPNKPASNIPANLRKYIDVAKTFEKLTKTQQEAILKEIDGQGAKASELGGKQKLRDFYDALTWSEAWTDSLVKKFEADREGARKDIVDMLAQETNKKGELTSKGRALADKLRAEGFLDKNNKLLRERNLLKADMTASEFAFSKGAVISRESDGKTHMYINLNSMGDETFPHELFHTIMRESPMKKHFTDNIVQKLLGSYDKDGKLVRPSEVNLSQVSKFFKKYIELTNRNDDGTLNSQAADALFKNVEEALSEYQKAGDNKKISDKARGLLEHYTEEFGAYYFSHWLMGRNRNTLFFGGELKGIEGIVERAKDSFKDFWQSKISKANPEFDFSKGLNDAFDRSKGLGRISSIDYFMRDMVRAASNANKDFFRPDAMTMDNLRDFERSNGLRNLTAVNGNRRLNPREQVTQNIRLGKEAYKILSGLDKNLRTSKDVLDENGKQVITGRFSEAELDALVKGGIVPRAWADKVNQGYAMLDGTISNVFSAGYLGKTEQTTDASYPRLTGKDVAFKNRKAVLFDVETKVKADGTFYTLFHTLDLAVIEQRANQLWQNSDYKNLWNGDRSAMEADFFKYISNASKAGTDTTKLDSAKLLENGDGNGAKRRDVLQQMAGMALQTGDAYKHQPIAVIPEGIRHSVTTFNIDGMTMPRVETGARYDINMGNAHKFIRENWQPSEMVQEKTPNGVLMTHESGFKFAVNNGKTTAYTSAGRKIGTFDNIKSATNAAKSEYKKVYDNLDRDVDREVARQDQEITKFQPLEENERNIAFEFGDLFAVPSVKAFVGDRLLLRQTREEHIFQRALEAIEDPEKLYDYALKAFEKEKVIFDESNRLQNEYEVLLHNYVKQKDSLETVFNRYEESLRSVPMPVEFNRFETWLQTRPEFKGIRKTIEDNGFYSIEGYLSKTDESEYWRQKALYDSERHDIRYKFTKTEDYQNQLKIFEAKREALELTVGKQVDLLREKIQKFKEQNKIVLSHEGLQRAIETLEDFSYTSEGGEGFTGNTSKAEQAKMLASLVKANVNAKDYSGLLEKLFAADYDDKIQTGVPFVAVTTHGTKSVRLMLTRLFEEGKLGTTFAWAESSKLGQFSAGSQKTSGSSDYSASKRPVSLSPEQYKVAVSKIDAFNRELINLYADALIAEAKSRGEDGWYTGVTDVNGNEVKLSRDELVGRLIQHNRDKLTKGSDELVINFIGARRMFDGQEAWSFGLEGGNEGLNTGMVEVKNQELVKKINDYNDNLRILREGYGLDNIVTSRMALEGKSLPPPVKMQTRQLIRMDNPYVVVDPRSYEEKNLSSHMKKAIALGHDGIVFKFLADGGDKDTVFAVFSEHIKKNIKVTETSFDSVGLPRGSDESGRKLLGGRDLKLHFQPTDEGEAPKQIHGIKLDMTKAYDVFRQEYEESTGQSWSREKFMQRASNWQFFGDENGFVAVRPQRSGFVKLVGMAGDNKSKLRGIQQIQQMGLPVWGMVSKDIKDIAVKRGMREPNMIERTLLKQALNSAALGDAEILGYTPDNGVRLRYPDIGEVTKYMVGSPEYYQKLRSAFGEQIKSKIGFQPNEDAEGGRVYDQNSNKFKYGFIGKWAEENPERIKGYNLEFIDRGTKYGTHNVRIRLQDNSTVGMTENVGHITADIDPKTKIASLSSNIGVKYRGNKLSYALYSEMAERLRSMGVQKVDGTIVNSDGIPIKVREKIIGNTKMLRYDGSSGLPIDYKQGAGIIQRRQAESGNTWGGLDVVNELDFKARYQPTEIPKEKGTSEIKKGYTRVYHQTTAENIESIMKRGLLVSKSRPTSESRGVSVSETPFYGNNPNLVTIELQVPTEKLRQANGSALLEDVPASNIIAVHEDWHEKARYIEKNPASLKEVLNGDMDFMLGDGSPEAKAIEYIKDKHSKDKPKLQPTEGEKAPVNWVKDGFNKEGYNAEVIWMTPERFLKLAAPLGDRANNESSRARIEQIKKTLQTKGGDMDMPYFSMKRNKNGELQVSGHEGRHRAIAIQELYGDKKIPVYLTMDEMMKIQNRGDMDFGVSESERKKGTVSKEFKALEDAPFLNELGTGRFQPAELEVLNITRTQDIPWFRNLIAGGSYVRYAGIEELNYLRGLQAVSHGADTLTGVDVNTTQGRRIVEGKGGLGYALNPNNEAAWASIGKGFIELINQTVQANLDKEGIKEKTALLPLVFTTYRKNLNSVQGSEAYYNIFEILRRGQILSDKDLRIAMSKAVEKLYVNKKGEAVQSQTDALRSIVKNSKMNWDEMLSGIFATLANSDVQNFGTRGRMADDFFGAVWKRLDLSESKKKQIRGLFPEWKTVSKGDNITVEDMKTNVADITTDTLSKGLKNGDVYAILKFNDFVTDTKSNHRSYDTGVVQKDGKKPEIIILKKPVSIDDFYQSSVTSKGEQDLSNITDRSVKTNLLGMNARPYGQARVKLAGSVDFRDVAAKMQPSEGFSNFKTERTPTGVLLKNAAGYVISRVGSKYRVYNPYKAVIGVFDSEEQAKKRIYKEEPRR